MTDTATPAEVLAGPSLSFGFNLAKVPDHGEDADPILRDGPDLGLAAVFDGMGGAGGTVYETADGPRSGAYLASRIAQQVVEQRMLALLTPDRPLAGASTAADLHDAVEAALQAAVADLKAPASRLRSRLIRALPTTMALGALHRADGDEWTCQVLWAGDSRVYVLTADGLQQLSTDDLRDQGDALANLQRDSVISNALSADTEFSINHRRVTLAAPFLLICATDGCFGYLRSPMHFERILLSTLAAATDEEDWSLRLQAEIAAVTGDDASMATIGVGGDLGAMQQLLAGRLAEVIEQFTAPMDVLLEEVGRAERALADLQRRRDDDLASRWRQYRQGYERALHHVDEPDEAAAEEVPQRTIWNAPKPIGTGPRPAAAADRPEGEHADDEGAERT